MVYWYVERDGRVFLVGRGGKFVFPRPGEVDFEIKEEVGLGVNYPYLKEGACNQEDDSRATT